MLPDLSVLAALLLGLFALGGVLPSGQEAHALVGVIVTVLSATWMIRSVARRAVAAVREGDVAMVTAGRQWTSGWALLGYAGALFLFDWGALVAAFVPRVVWMAPVVVLLLPAAWLFVYAWRACGRIDTAIFAKRAESVPPEVKRSIQRGLKRNGIALLPIFLIFGITEGIWVAGELGVEQARTAAQWFEAMPLLALGATFGIIFLLLPFLPWIITRIIRGQPLPEGRLRRTLEQCAKRIGLRYRDIVLWRTNNRVVNAMVVGFTPGTRRIFLTDGIMSALTEDELLAVFFHEAGHAKRWHLPLLLTMFFSLGLLFHVLQEPLTTAGVPPLLVVALHLGVLWFGVLGFVSRRFEREADLYGAEHASILTPDAPAVEIEGLTRPIPRGAALMMRALDRVKQVSGKGISHRHGTIESRMKYIAAHATNPAVREAWHRDRRNLLLGIFGLLVLSAALVAGQVTTELATARARIGAQAGAESYSRAYAIRERTEEARPHWKRAHEAFVKAAAFVADQPEGSAEQVWIQATWNAGDAALHGLGDAALARPMFEALKKRLGGERRLGPFQAQILFHTEIELGRIAAWQGRPRTEAEAHLQAALASKLRRIPTDELSDEERDAHNYRTERLSLLEATIDARLGSADGAAVAKPKLELLTQSTSKSERWVELRADAQIELDRLEQAN